MANRHLARSLVLQVLFEWDFRGCSEEEALAIAVRDCEEYAPGLTDLNFVNKLLKGIISKQKEIDAIIVKAAPEWPLDKISAVDRNVLRIGLFELIFADKGEVPSKVAINESIELAKTFGGENSGKFINGVLGTVFKEMGEPDKDAKPQPKNKFTIPYEKMPIEALGGSVVVATEDDQAYIALVHDVFGHWTLPKGHLLPEENLVAGVNRVVSEEIGVPIEAGAELGKNEYIATDPEKGKIRKQVTFCFATAPYKPLVLATSGGLDKAQWFKIEEVGDLNFYPDIVPIVSQAVSLYLAGK